MATNPIGAAFTSCPRCGAERRSLRSRFCSRCGLRLSSERALNVAWFVYEIGAVLVALMSLGLLVWLLRVLWLSRSGLWEFLKWSWS